MRLGVFLLLAVQLLTAATGVANASSPPPTPQQAPGENLAAIDGRKLSGKLQDEAEARLEKLLVSKEVKARTDFPGYMDGIDLNLSGAWNVTDANRLIKKHGLGLRRGETATITAVKLKGKHIEIHLDGGGAGRFAEGFGPPRKGEMEKVPGGSRINLRFNRSLIYGDVRNLDRLAYYLDPLIDPTAIREVAALEPDSAYRKGDVQSAAPAVDSPMQAPGVERPMQASMGMPMPTLPPPPPPPAKTTTVNLLPKASSAEPTKVEPTVAPPAPVPPPAEPVKVAPAPAASAKEAPRTVTVGMERATVIEIMGRPQWKRVDVSTEVPIETWQYDLPDGKKRVITVQGGKVLKIE